MAAALAVVAEIGELELAQGRAFGFGAVVREEHHNGVFERTHRLDLSEHAPDFDVHAVNHRGMDRHFGGLEAALFRNE